MKKIIVLIAAVVFPFALSAQSDFDKYIDSDDVGSVIINKNLLGMVAKFSNDSNEKEAQEFIEMADNIDEIKVFMTSKSSASEDMASTVKKYLRKSNMELLMQVKEKDNKVDFYVKSSKNDEIVDELLMFVKSDESNGHDFNSVLVTMSGKIELEKLGALVNKMNLPKELEQAEKSKK